MSSRFRSPRSQALSTKRASLARAGLGSVDFRAIPPRIKPPLEVVAVQDWPRPKGYVNGAIIRGRTLHVAGQVGWTPEGRFEKKDFSGQFDRALGNVVAIVRAAGGKPEHIARMTIYVTDLDAYRTNLKGVGEAWRAHLGRHFPAMALVGVAGLVEREALVEIEAVAALDHADA